MMFFAKPGIYKPCGIFTLGHMFLLSITGFFIFLALKINKNIKKEKVKKQIIIITNVVWILEIIKILFNLFIRKW